MSTNKNTEIETVNETIGSLSEAGEDSLKDLYLTFHLGNEDYGIEIRYVLEIVGMQRITEVPDMPGFLKGVVNLRGQIIPVLDMRIRFNMSSRNYDERTCIIVVNIDNVQVGLVVDTINEVCHIAEEMVSPPPETAGASSAQYIHGMGKFGDEVVILLDGRKIVFEHEMAAVA